MSTTNRNHKDGLFRMLFSDKAELLSLYNALNGTNYDNPDELLDTTVKDVVFLGHKNDASFIIHNHLGVYEHQSTYCGNMPLRSLIYIGKQYAKYVAITRKYEQDKSIDHDTAIRLAVEDCIESDVLAKFLTEHREEVEAVCIEEYNRKNHEKSIHEDGVEIGEARGIQNLIKRMCGMGMDLEEAIQVAAEDFDKSINEVKNIIEN